MSYLIEFMQDKWRYWLTLCELKDGMMSLDDWNSSAERLIQEYQLPEGPAMEVRKSLNCFAAILVGQGQSAGNAVVETDKVVRNLTGFLLTNRAEALDYVDSVVSHVLKAVDTDQDDFINEEQFNSVCKSLLLKEKYWRAVYMCLANPETGNINTTRGSVWWVDFIMGVDKENWEETKQIFTT